MVRAEQLNTETRAVIVEISTIAKGTQELVQQQFREVLHAVLSGAAVTAEQAKIDPERLEHQLLENVRRELTPSPQRGAAEAADGGTDHPPATPTPASRAAARRAAERRVRRQSTTGLRTFPDEEAGRASLERLRGLSPTQQQRLDQLAQDEVDSSDYGSYVGLTPVGDDDELQRAGLTRRSRVRTPDGLSTVTVLSDQGKELGRLLAAEGDLPPWLDLSDVATNEPPPAVPGDDDIPF
jgi:hypothetical protein